MAATRGFSVLDPGAGTDLSVSAAAAEYEQAAGSGRRPLSGARRQCKQEGAGASMRHALREKAIQDLVYHSEYLATLVAGAATPSNVSPDEQPRTQLQSSSIPRVVDTAALMLQGMQADLVASSAAAGAPRSASIGRCGKLALRGSVPFGSPPPVPHLGSARTPRQAAAATQHTENLRCRLDHLCSTGKQAPVEPSRPELAIHHPFHCGVSELRHVHRVQRQLGWNAAAVADPSCIVDNLHGRSVYGDVLNEVRDMVSLYCKGGGVSQDLAKTPMLTAPDLSILGADHTQSTEIELRRHACNCRHVELLSDDWQPDFSATALAFARLFWARADVGAAVGGVCSDAALDLGTRRFRRADGEGEFSSSRRFSLVEQRTVMQRLGSDGPHSAHALVIGERPAAALLQGHYTEVQIISVFETAVRADWMQRREPGDGKTRHRSDGLAIGFTASRPPSPGEKACSSDALATSVARLPQTWSITTNGSFYAKSGAAMDSQTDRHQLSWSIALGEGDCVGLLATCYGGLVLFVNGAHELMVPDAGVRVDVDLYPIVETSNHIRSVRLVAGALPPPVGPPRSQPPS